MGKCEYVVIDESAIFVSVFHPRIWVKNEHIVDCLVIKGIFKAEVPIAMECKNVGDGAFFDVVFE